MALVTILSRGFQIMFAAIILALSGGAIVLFGMWAIVAFADRGAHFHAVSAKNCPVPGYMTSGTPDQDTQGVPTDDGLSRRMYRIAPTC
jgi:hypothetical protein